MTHLLRFTNPWGEHFFFVRLGEQWPSNPMHRFIDATTTNRDEARVFETEELAREVMVVAGRPVGWTVEEA